jgi:hypothetical protein
MLALLWMAAAQEARAMDEAPQTSAGILPAAFALPLPDLGRYEGIPRFPTNMPVSSVLRAAMQLIAEDLELQWEEPLHHGLRMDPAQAVFMGVTGEAFAFLWFSKGPERPPLDATLYWPDPAAPYRRALTAAGFTCEVLMGPGLTGGQALDPQTLKDRVRGCLLDERLPVILAGLPDLGSFMLVGGYDEGGDVLTGWTASGGSGEVLFDPNAKAQVRDWPAAAQLVVLLTGRQERTPLRATMRDALEQAVHLLRMSETGPYHAGSATFETWAEALLSDDPPDLSMPPNTPPTTIEGRRRWLICPATWDLMERASYAESFLSHAAKLFPAAADELDAAATCMGEVGGLMAQVEQAMGGRAGDDPALGYPKADDPEARRQAADLILHCRDKELAAADHLEAALPLMQ